MTDLSSLNHFVPHVHFQMEGRHGFKPLLRKGDSMTSIDLKDSYFFPFQNFNPLKGFFFSSGAQSSAWNIHQAPETCSRLPEEAGLSHNNLLRQRPSPYHLPRGSIASNASLLQSLGFLTNWTKSTLFWT